jgi:hypothetical protein
MTTHTAVILDLYKGLFRDDTAYLEFVETFRTASRSDLAPVFFGDELLGSVLSPEGTKELLAERFLKRLSEKPELLTEIADRLENDEIVE